MVEAMILFGTLGVICWARGLHQSQDRPGGTLSETLYKPKAPEKDTGSAAIESVTVT